MPYRSYSKTFKKSGNYPQKGLLFDQKHRGHEADLLYSAGSVELDGVADYVNIGNLGTLSKAVAKIQYQARRGTANCQPRFRLNSGLDLAGASLVRPGVWEDGENYYEPGK